MRQLVFLAALLAAVLPGGAQAHAFLDHAVPAVGATVQSPPRQVQLFFTQELEPAFSSATIVAASGQPVPAGAAAIDPQNKMEMVLNLPGLAPGTYKVSWHAVSVDTHRTEGSFSFEVRP